jgi:hypothetical protein
VIADPSLDLIKRHSVGGVWCNTAAGSCDLERLPSPLSELEAQSLERALDPILLSAHVSTDLSSLARVFHMDVRKLRRPYSHNMMRCASLAGAGWQVCGMPALVSSWVALPNEPSDAPAQDQNHSSTNQ